MGRQRYETGTDLKNEERVALAVAEKTGLDYQKLSPHLYGADFVFYEERRGSQGFMGIPKYWAEIKCRRTRSTDFDRYMISLGKFMRLRQLDFDTQARAVIIVRFADVTLRCDALCSFDTGMGRRAEMRDELDMEPMAFIPMENFNRF